MGAYEPDIDNPIRIVDPDYDAVLVADDVEYGASVLENTGAAYIPFYVRRFTPISLLDLSEPRHKRLTGISHDRAIPEEKLNLTERDNSHRNRLS
jgi:hypothetical protein